MGDQDCKLRKGLEVQDNEDKGEDKEKVECNDVVRIIIL